jgi:hypothetical protein
MGPIQRLLAIEDIKQLRARGDLVTMLASAQMGFVTGQNIVNDGGAYSGLF